MIEIALKELALVVGMMAMGEAVERDETEVICLARNIYHEARGEALRGRVAVAHVTLNRAAGDDHPEDICDVVYEDRGAAPHDCQFSWTCDGRADLPHNWRAYQDATHLALQVLSGRCPDPTAGAQFYMTHRDRYPGWTSNLHRVADIGAHRFWRAEDKGD